MKFNDATPILLESGFNKLNIKDASRNINYVSPEFSKTLIYMDREIIVLDFKGEGIYKEPVVLTNPKIISDSQDKGVTIYFTREKNTLKFDFQGQTVQWSYTNDSGIAHTWVFEEISRKKVGEPKQFIKNFRLSLENLSENSQNLIGYNMEEITYLYSKSYDSPKMYNYNRSTKESVWEFQPVDKSIEHKAIIRFNKKGLCIAIKLLFNESYKESILSVYNDSYGFQSNNSWMEKTENNTYLYRIEVQEDFIVINIE